MPRWLSSASLSTASLLTVNYPADFLFFCAAAAPFFPSAVRTDFGRCEIVRFFLAAAAAFEMFFLAAFFCFELAILIAPVISNVLTVMQAARNRQLRSACIRPRTLAHDGACAGRILWVTKSCAFAQERKSGRLQSDFPSFVGDLLYAARAWTLAPTLSRRSRLHFNGDTVIAVIPHPRFGLSRCSSGISVIKHERDARAYTCTKILLPHALQ